MPNNSETCGFIDFLFGFGVAITFASIYMYAFTAGGPLFYSTQRRQNITSSSTYTYGTNVNSQYCTQSVAISVTGITVSTCSSTDEVPGAFFSPKTEFESNEALGKYPSLRTHTKGLLGQSIATFVLCEIYTLVTCIVMYILYKSDDDSCEGCCQTGNGMYFFPIMAFVVIFVEASTLMSFSDGFSEAYTKDKDYCLDDTTGPFAGKTNIDLTDTSAFPLADWGLCVTCNDPAKQQYTFEDLKNKNEGPCSSFSGSAENSELAEYTWGAGVTAVLRVIIIVGRCIVFLMMVLIARSHFADHGIAQTQTTVTVDGVDTSDYAKKTRPPPSRPSDYPVNNDAWGAPNVIPVASAPIPMAYEAPPSYENAVGVSDNTSSGW